jgi:hypothetical protein
MNSFFDIKSAQDIFIFILKDNLFNMRYQKTKHGG